MQNGEASEGSSNDEKSIENNQERKTQKICIKNLPAESVKEDVEKLIQQFGKLTHCDIVSPNPEQVNAYITFESIEESTDALENLNNTEYQGKILRVDFITSSQRPKKQQRGRFTGPGGGRGTGYPLRILVFSDYVGAIIGRKGQTIKNITTQSRARVDVHCKENTGLLEKIISIYGQPDNCSNACKEIMKVMQQEAHNSNRGDICLKMLAEDRYCGRIIGKKGAIIKQIREETTTKIYVSNLQEVPGVYPDRVITITGQLDNMQQAENKISQKLRECFENEAIPPAPHAFMPPQAASFVAPYRLPFHPQQAQHYMQPAMPYPTHAPQQQQQQLPPVMPPFQIPQIPHSDVCQIYVPHSSVGSIIGAGGSSIKQIIRDSGAYVTVEQKVNENDNPEERIITIKGPFDAQSRALFYIFERIKGDNYGALQNCRLRVSFRIPRSIVGRIIGKGGKNVKDIQRTSGATIKLPEETSDSVDTPVDITGNCYSIQQAMYQVKSLVAAGHNRQE